MRPLRICEVMLYDGFGVVKFFSVPENFKIPNDRLKTISRQDEGDVFEESEGSLGFFGTD